ncbi:3-oxoacyl-ACP reductase family protein [Komagataeibacter sp. FXV3]|uniref:3-oxoacyl-ACP reductase family protein n=1 Tax=Komagataeibacter sp. FXV3 TaxID=2608998 RepID=UPI00187B43D1|nr:3-oxoacyl-ACP reductase family protein [Komagataeibacter sp. FXV3]MBE7728753.1 3-oxoacyl-ACP reductase FabG [Komagataeibacter sp. FXV3]
MTPDTRTPIDNTLSGRVAIVTGGSRGIGRAVALALGRAGVHVAVNYHSDEAAAREVCARIEAMGSRAVAIRADVGEADDVAALVRKARDTLGTVTVLVNNAGISRLVPLDRIELQDWNDLLRTNLTSAFLMTQAVLPPMRQARWGRIINMSSIAAQTGGVIGPHYAASKAGMLGLTHSYANLLAREGITVNAIAPALIESDMIANNPAIRPDMIPMGRFGTADEVADLTVATLRNGYVTGQTINLNGGWYMN